MNQGELTLPAARASGLGFAGRVRRSGLIAPALIFAIVVTQYAVRPTIWFSPQKWNLLRPENSKFNGIQNYIDLFQVGDFVPALINTVIRTSTAVIASLLLGLLMADLVNARFRGRDIVRTLLITSFLVMPVVGALGWKTTMLNPVFGVVDWVLTSVGLPRIDWFASVPLLSVTWITSPAVGAVHDAHPPRRSPGAERRGPRSRQGRRASTWQEFRYIELPHLKGYMQLAVLLGTIYILAELAT